MEEKNIKLFSEMERFEIININDGDKHGYLCDNDVIIDEDGKLKLLILNNNRSKFSFFSNNVFTEVPWEYVKKVGSKTIIIDVDENNLNKARL